jgi:hypothetical protein
MVKGVYPQKIETNIKASLFVVGLAVSFLFLSVTLTPSYAEFIDGPANVRLSPKGKVVLSLNNGVHVAVVSTQGEWNLIRINALLDKNAFSTESKVRKGATLYDERGSEMGKTLDEADVKKSIEKNGKYVVLIEGYTFKDNITANAVDRDKNSKINCTNFAKQLQKELSEPKYREKGLAFDSCSDLEHAIELFSLSKDSNGNWMYTEENQLRQQLWKKYGVQIPSDILVAGYIERVPPDGDSFLIVLGIGQNSDRAETAGYLASEEKKKKKIPDRKAIPRILLEGWSLFNKVGFYPVKKPHVTLQGEWVDVSSADGWGTSDPMRRQARACLPCQGWLCDAAPLMCFTDFNQNGREEIHMKGHAEDFDSLLVLEIAARGKPKTLLQRDNSAGHWKNWKDQWIFIGDITCEGGEFCGNEEFGNPNCYLPPVYRFDKNGLLREDPLLVNEFYPVEEQVAPPGCAIDKPETVLLPNGKFIRYLPSKKQKQR